MLRSSHKVRTRVLSRRHFLRLAAIGTAAGAALAGCAPRRPTQPAGTGPGEEVQLVYQDWRTEWFPPLAQQLLEQFHASHPHIRVFYVPDPPSEVFQEETLQEFQAGTAADVFDGCCSFYPIWAQKGYTLDLRPYVDGGLDRATIDDWDVAQYQALFTRDGRQFGLPKYHGALALYYNKDILDEAGVDYPDRSWNHDDYLAAMKRLTRKRDGDGGPKVWGSMFNIDWERIQVHVNAWGGHLVDPGNPSRSLMAEPPALAAMEWLRARIWDDRVMPAPLDVRYQGTAEAFYAGRLAMVEDGSWALKAILTNATFRVGVAPMPTGPARPATLATTDGLSIYAGTRHPDEAWELLKFLVGSDSGRAMARAHLLQPARESLVEEWIRLVQDEYPTKARDMDIAAFADGHRKGYSVVAESFADMALAQTLVYKAWDQIFAQGRAPIELMKTVSEQVEAGQPGGPEGE